MQTKSGDTVSSLFSKKGAIYGRYWLHIVFSCAFLAMAVFFVISALIGYIEYTSPLTAAEQAWMSLQTDPRPTGMAPIVNSSFLAIASVFLAYRSTCQLRGKSEKAVFCDKLVNKRRVYAIPQSVALAVVSVGAVFVRVTYRSTVLDGAGGLSFIGLLILLSLVSASRIFELDEPCSSMSKE